MREVRNRHGFWSEILKLRHHYEIVGVGGTGIDPKYNGGGGGGGVC